MLLKSLAWSFIVVVSVLCGSIVHGLGEETVTTASLRANAVTSIPLIVQTTEGKVKGFVNAQGVNQWRSLRYAAPPLGQWRFEKPQTPSPYSAAIYDASPNYPGCLQFTTPQLPEGYSEDCLFLSIFAPTQIDRSKYPDGLPVMFYIHGGHNIMGQGNLETLDGSNYAKKNVITVFINYRLGMLANFMTSDNGGNNGFYDQRAALEWVRKNIAGFGGNAKKVTMVGDKVGGGAVANHLVSPGSADLFQHAVITSNAFGGLNPEKSVVVQKTYSAMQSAGCTSVQCMKDLPLDKLMDAVAFFGAYESVYLNANLHVEKYSVVNAPYVEEGGEIPKQPFYAMSAGEYSLKPTIIGGVEDEGIALLRDATGYFNAVYKARLNVFALQSFAAAASPTLDDRAQAVYDLYPCLPGYCPQNPSQVVRDVFDANLIFAKVMGNKIYDCPAIKIAKNSINLKNSPKVYMYNFQQVPSKDCFGGAAPACNSVACQGVISPFFFGTFNCQDVVNINIPGTWTPTPDELKTSETIINYMTNFAHTGNPNKGPVISLPVWKSYTVGSQNTRIFKEPSTEVKNYLNDKCELWDSLNYHSGYSL